MSDGGAFMIMVGLLVCAWGLFSIASEVEDAGDLIAEALTPQEVVCEMPPASVDIEQLTTCHRPEGE